MTDRDEVSQAVIFNHVLLTMHEIERVSSGYSSIPLATNTFIPVIQCPHSGIGRSPPCGELSIVCIDATKPIVRACCTLSVSGILFDYVVEEVNYRSSISTDVIERKRLRRL
jgi:hypothetical protein